MLQYFDNAMICTAWAVWTVATFRLTAFTTFLSHIAVTIMQGYCSNVHYKIFYYACPYYCKATKYKIFSNASVIIPLCLAIHSLWSFILIEAPACTRENIVW